MPEQPLLFDSHCHLTDPRFDEDRDEVLARARSAGVARMVTIGAGYGRDGFDPALDLCRAHPGRLRCAVGIHPHDATLWTENPEEIRADLVARLADEMVVAVGETGLDYYYHDDSNVQKAQRDSFAAHCALAVETGLPLVVHTRAAFADTVPILYDHGIGRDVAGVIHFFTTTVAEAEAYLDLGLHLSIPGVVTLPNAPDLVAAVPHLPLDRLLIETDSPYAAPVPKRGRRNEPAYVTYVADKVAELKQLAPEEVAAATYGNACAFYDWEE